MRGEFNSKKLWRFAANDVDIFSSSVFYFRVAITTRKPNYLSYRFRIPVFFCFLFFSPPVIHSKIRTKFELEFRRFEKRLFALQTSQSNVQHKRNHRINKLSFSFYVFGCFYFFFCSSSFFREKAERRRQ